MGFIQGKYFSWTSASLAGGEDLVTIAESKTGLSNIHVRKLTIIASGSLLIDINNLGVDSTLFQDADGYYKLSLDADDCVISSVALGETAGSPVFVAMVFS